jgi:hypothetical protein
MSETLPKPDLAAMMRTLGEIARAVFPSGDVPTPMQVQLLSRPAMGLGMLTRHEAYQRADKRMLGPLFCRLPPNMQEIDCELSEAILAHYWDGFLGES